MLGVRQELVPGFACRRVLKLRGERPYVSFADLKRALSSAAERLRMLPVVLEQADIEGEGKYYTLSLGFRAQPFSCDIRLFIRRDGEELELFRSGETSEFEASTVFVGNVVGGSTNVPGANEVVSAFVGEVRNLLSKALEEVRHDLGRAAE